MDALDLVPQKQINCLDKGFVKLVDVMPRVIPDGATCDYAIAQMARVSYGAGTKSVNEDKGLIRYLLRHAHTSPFEGVEFKFHMRMPIFIARQAIRHRTACLSGDSLLYFDEPAAIKNGKRKSRRISISEFYKKWHKGASPIKTIWGSKIAIPLKERLSEMNLRSCDEITGEIKHTKVTDIWETGTKDVFEVELKNGYKLKMTKDHLCLTEDGWFTLEQATNLNTNKRGHVVWNNLHTNFAVNGILCCKDKKLIRTFSKIKQITYIGKEMTYDLSVSGHFHNFVCNGFIVHNSLNEISGRYSMMKDEFYIPSPENIRKQSQTNKQGGDESIDIDLAKEFSEKIELECKDCYSIYLQMLDAGVAREQARMILPLNLYTEWYWKQDLHNLLHFLALRADSHAQQEIRVYAEAIIELITPLVPWTIEAWNDYHSMRGAIKLTRLEKEALNNSNICYNDILDVDSKNAREKQEWLSKKEELFKNTK